MTGRFSVRGSVSALVLVWGFSVWGSVSGLVSAAEGERPNILVVITDDQRWDAFSHAGHPWFRTPNLDRLASEGVRFANAFVTTSLCSPSRASMLSGVYPHRHGVLNNFTDFPDDLASYPRALRDAGYATAYIGKWHMGEDEDRPRPGFDHWMSHKGQGRYFDNEFNINGRRELIEGYYTTVVTRAAADYIRNVGGARPADRPWLLIVGHKAPHGGPIEPEPRYARAFDGFAVEKPSNAGAYRAADGKPAWLEASHPTWHGSGGPLYNIKDYGTFVRSYFGTIASVDDGMGELDAALRESGQYGNTATIFLSDNGFALGEHGRVDKRTMYEESVRIPLLARWPGRFPAGRSVREMVLNLDLAPTVMEIGGAVPPEGLDGRSWVGMAKGGEAPADWRREWLYEYNYEVEFPYTPNVRGVRGERWKYIRYPHGDGSPDRHEDELYDLEADPGEVRNLARDPEHAGVLAEMRGKLERMMRERPASARTMHLDEGIRNVLPRF